MMKHWWLALVLSALVVDGLGCMPDPAPSGTIPESVQEPASGRGCCSHHRGVCGCSGGRTVCCDNTLSRTCSC